MLNDDETIPPRPQPKWRTRYAKAEAFLDSLMTAWVGSQVTLALFVVWTVGMVLLGMWIGTAP